MKRAVAVWLTLLSAAHCRVIPVPPSCGTQCATAIQQALTSCAANAGTEECVVQLSAGTYPIATTPLRLVSGKNVSVVGAGSATILELQDIGSLFDVAHSSAVTLSGFAVDMHRLPYTLCTAVSSAAGKTTCQFNETVYPFSSGQKWLNYAQAIIEYDAKNDRMGTAVDIYALDNSITVTANGDMLTISHSLPTGKSYIVRHVVYGYNGINADTVTDFAVRDVDFYSLPGMGVVTWHCTNVHLQRVATRKVAGRPMSICADGIHLTSCRGGAVVVEDCWFEGQGDDGMNIPSLYQDILTMDAARRALTVGSRGEQQQAPDFQIGDAVVIYSRHNFAVLTTATVASVNATVVTMRDPLPAQVGVYDLLWNAASAPDYVLLRNSVFRNNRARGALLKADNLLAINNTFDHTTGPGIQAYPDGCYWFEGNVVTNWTLSGNRFLGTNYATARLPGNVFVAACVPTWNGTRPTNQGNPATATTIFNNLNVLDNYFEQTQPETALTMYAVKQLTVSGNTVVYPQQPTPHHFACNACTGVTATNNSCGLSPTALAPCGMG